MADPCVDPFSDFVDTPSKPSETECHEVPVTTAVTLPVYDSEPVPPPRPPKPPKQEEARRSSLEIFPDEQRRPADPFAVLESSSKDEIMDELFGDSNGCDDFSHSPTQFESVHHRLPPPLPPQQPAKPQQQQQQKQHHIRASISEKADRLKHYWLK